MKANLLKAEMVKQGINGKELSATIGISESAFYRKMSGDSQFTQGEISDIARALQMDRETILDIFFAEEVS